MQQAQICTDVLRETNLDIVFSDADNVFKSDPFLPSLSLGSMIRSGKYEYIYGRKIEPGGQKIQNLNPEVYHQELSKRILASTMLPVVENRTLFREYLRSVWSGVIDAHLWMTRRTFGTALWLPGTRKVQRKAMFACFRHCDNDKCQGVDESMVLNYCDMSPWEYILGCFSTESALQEPRMVSYHATHVFGWPAKKGKLQNVKLWANCDESEITGVRSSQFAQSFTFWSFPFFAGQPKTCVA